MSRLLQHKRTINVKNVSQTQIFIGEFRKEREREKTYMCYTAFVSDAVTMRKNPDLFNHEIIRFKLT
ncbi:hypothetical protein QJS04_geneDACA010355 [Acorus gramineus]|uniref:Uncharacterized protein n=1 Tax=Acorus gramineus TaxID=55184 RepID=A0AAV9A4H8_ACOGR|nr:hypothetical protein QJS04_geneDACA010355 [Acorus gramineus]